MKLKDIITCIAVCRCT